jgi:hypothetical protein
MKTRLFSFCLSAIAAFLFISLVPAWAGSSDTLKFNLTEAAAIGVSPLAPGEYTAHILDTGSDTPVMKLESAAGLSLMIPVMRTNIRNNDETPHVTLSRRDGALRLTDFQFSGESFSYEVLTH